MSFFFTADVQKENNLKITMSYINELVNYSNSLYICEDLHSVI